MDRPELLARDYLISQGYNPIFEPLGKTTCPDFEIDKSIAVEVRRLNENFFQKTRPEGLRQTTQPIWDGIEDVFAGYKKDNPENNYWVSLKLKRPVEQIKTIKWRLKEILNTFEIGGNSQINTIEVSPSVTLKLSPKGTIENQIFHLGSMLDFDSGGFVISNIIENMSFCIEEKTNKIKSCQSKYKCWWLILIDEISYGLSQEDKQYVASKMEKPPIWEKVITLNTLNGEKILEI